MKKKETNKLLNEVLSQGVNRYERVNERLVSVEIWDKSTNDWQAYDCPTNTTVRDYAEWCIGADSDYWATINNPNDKIRLNGWYIIDGLSYFN